MAFLVVLALVLAPGSALAQDQPVPDQPLPDEPLPEPEPPPPTAPEGRPSNDPYGTAHLRMPTPASTPWYATGQARDPERVLGPPIAARPVLDDLDNLPTAIIGGVVGYGLGLLSAYLIIAATIEEDDGLIVLAGPLAIFSAGLCIAGGIDIGGDSNGHEGSFWAAFGGQALGGLASLLVILATIDDRDAEWLGITAFLLFPVAGGVIGYEMSDDPSEGP